MAVNPKDDILRLDSNVPYQISVLSHRIARETAAITERHGGLNISQWRVMAAVAERPGRTANEVVAITPMDKGIVSRAVKALLDKGMLARKASNEDGRLGHLFLTARGEKKYAALAADIRGIEAELLSGLSGEDAARLRRLIGALCQSFQGGPQEV